MKITFLIGIFILCFLCAEYSQAQVRATGKGYFAASWDAAKSRLDRRPIGNTPNFSIEIHEVISQDRAGALIQLGRIETGQKMFSGSEFRFNDLPDNTEYLFKICHSGSLVGRDEDICYEYRIFVPARTRTLDLGSFVFIINQARWVPLNVILDN